LKSILGAWHVHYEMNLFQQESFCGKKYCWWGKSCIGDDSRMISLCQTYYQEIKAGSAAAGDFKMTCGKKKMKCQNVPIKLQSTPKARFGV